MLSELNDSPSDMLPNLGLEHLFSTNTAPIPLEILQIQNEIGTLTDAVRTLQAQLQEAEKQRRRYQDLLSPVRRTPPEVLGEIFIFTPE
jgi:hypothetical protein